MTVSDHIILYKEYPNLKTIGVLQSLLAIIGYSLIDLLEDPASLWKWIASVIMILSPQLLLQERVISLTEGKLIISSGYKWFSGVQDVGTMEQQQLEAIRIQQGASRHYYIEAIAKDGSTLLLRKMTNKNPATEAAQELLADMNNYWPQSNISLHEGE